MITDAAFVDLHRQCAAAIRKGSKTFSFASFFFGKRESQGACLLYTWCRHCDDQIDEAPIEEKATRLQELLKQTRLALETNEKMDLPFEALRQVVRQFQIPDFYPLELLEGMRMDVENVRYECLEDLLLYCYRVAGVVGLMMAHIMGVNDSDARKAACDLGLAMQLTNCARDVRVDFAMGRIYLPLSWLRELGVDLKNLMNYREQLALVVDRMLLAADELYASGENGAKHLPLKSSFVILIARFSYARIGHKVRALGAEAWDQRVYTRPLEKVLCLCAAAGVWLRQWPDRSRFEKVVALPIWEPPRKLWERSNERPRGEVEWRSQ